MQKSNTINLAGFTICTKNYLSYARVLAETFLKYHPKGSFFVLFLDSYYGYFDPKKEKFTAISIKDIKKIGNINQFVFKYDVTGVNTGIKPFFIEYLFANYAIGTLFYFDTDIKIFAKLSEAIGLLKRNNILLVPHVTSPLPDDGKIASDQYILNAGCYNLGFIGLRNTKETMKFILWWQKKTFDGAVAKVAEGLFRDQRPIDLVPSIFDKVAIFKDHGYDVAYWNLHERSHWYKIRGKFYVGKSPLIFFHFSGYQLGRPDVLSYHQNRFSFSNFNPILRNIFDIYATELKRNGFDDSILWPYTYDTYRDGTKITLEDRTNFWSSRKNYPGTYNPFLQKINPPSDHRIYWEIKNLPPVWLTLLITRKLVGDDTYLKITDFLMKKFLPKYYKLVPPKKVPFRVVRKETKFGVTVFAKFSADSGVAECAKSLSKLLRNTNIPCSFIDIDKPNEGAVFYPINLFFFNADTIQDLLNNHLDPSVWSGKYNIGYFWWELEKFPDKFFSSFNNLSEVWTGSDFCKQAIEKMSPVPVKKIPWIPQLPETNKSWTRADFNVPDRKFMFLYSYDSGHYPERKNSIALVRSFIKANFPPDKVILVIKIMHFDQKVSYNKQLMNEITKCKNITVITETYSREKNIGLIKMCDCYISPHRSEGFGATIWEAMALGKPVIVTRYGGSMDFTRPENSYLVDYDLTTIKRNIGPYDKGLYWAEPSIIDLAKKMKMAVENKDLLENMGRKGQEFIEATYDPKLITRLLERTLREINLP